MKLVKEFLNENDGMYPIKYEPLTIKRKGIMERNS